MLYTVSFELCHPGQSNISDTMQVEAVSEKRALEHAQHTLEEQYPGEEDYLLLECEVRKPGRPRQFPRREKTSWEMSQELLNEINRRRGSLGRSIYIEQELRKAWGMPPLQEKEVKGK